MIPGAIGWGIDPVASLRLGATRSYSGAGRGGVLLPIGVDGTDNENSETASPASARVDDGVEVPRLAFKEGRVAATRLGGTSPVAAVPAVPGELGGVDEREVMGEAELSTVAEAALESTEPEAEPAGLASRATTAGAGFVEIPPLLDPVFW